MTTMPLKTPETTPKRGLLAQILRPQTDVSESINLLSPYQWVVMVGEGVPEFFAGTQNMPVVELQSQIGLHGDVQLSVRPQEHLEKWLVFDGCFIYSSDSRFTSRFGGPIKLYDRYERE
jgi:hypothetical protein